MRKAVYVTVMIACAMSMSMISSAAVISGTTEGCSCDQFMEALERSKVQHQQLQQQVKTLQDNLHSLIHLLNGQAHVSQNSDDLERKDLEDGLRQLRTFGIRGTPGKDGENGKDGRDGIDGRDGASGAPGRPGAKGTSGEVGEPGPSGPQGLIGPVGSPGAKGTVGPRGPNGLPGSVGLPGAKGNIGPRGPRGSTGESGKSKDRGAVYTRWGRTTCGSNSQRIYEGFAAGTFYSHTGGGANYQCLPLNPQYNFYDSQENGWQGSWIHGVEYQSYNRGIFRLPTTNAHNQNVPCARCYTKTRGAVMMIPARRSCPDGWTEEYEGYLMTERHSHNRATYEYECIDESPEYVVGASSDRNGALFYFVRPGCYGNGTIEHCPPYYSLRELTCVVCTK